MPPTTCAATARWCCAAAPDAIDAQPAVFPDDDPGSHARHGGADHRPEPIEVLSDINAVLGGRSLTDYVAAGGARSLFLIADDYVLPYSWNTTAGAGWQLNRVTSLDVDYVHIYGRSSSAPSISTCRRAARSAPPIRGRWRNSAEVKVMQNNTTSWYNALETQLRTRVRGADSLQVSYTLALASATASTITRTTSGRCGRRSSSATRKAATATTSPSPARRTCRGTCR